MLPVSAETRQIVPIDAAGDTGSLALLRQFGAAGGWVEEVSAQGPRFRLPCGGIFSWEPGGQIEFSTRPYRSATALLQTLHSVVLPLRAMAAAEGVELLSIGIDPCNPVKAVPLQLHSERYARMATYLDTLGPAGARMMRQTASFQLNLDWGAEPLLPWRVMNAAAPYVTAIFANSGTYAGQETGFRSYRAQIWRELDPERTGVLGTRPDGVDEYLDFALGAHAMFAPSPEGEYLPFGEHLARGGVTLAAWHAHLTTLFPEVRPKGYMEIRSADALEPEWYAAPIALLSGIVYHRPSLSAAANLLGAPDPELLGRAARLGLSDAGIASAARDLFEIGLTGCAALGEGFIDGPSLEAAREFYDRFTRRARSPTDGCALLSCS
jgi:glutamate--cysteine ligase